VKLLLHLQYAYNITGSCYSTLVISYRYHWSNGTFQMRMSIELIS